MTAVTSLSLIADDLTGALDAAAPFAAAASPVRLPWHSAVTTGRKITVSTESRHLPADRAAAAVVDASAMLRDRLAGPDTLWFKKVDSVLRGNSLTETLALSRAGNFSTCIFAPAFPAMARITRGGRHLVRSTRGEWEETTHGDLRRAFAAISMKSDPEIIVIDAETQDDLRHGIHAWRGQNGILWAGSRGLAEALVGEQAPTVAPPVGLFVIGTKHPATRAQVATLKGMVTAAGEGPFTPDAAVPILLDPIPFSSTATQTRRHLKHALADAPPPSGDMAVLVTGGDTLTTVLDTVGALALDCIGEVSPGMPLSRIIGGRWGGTALISKSGGFGEDNVLQNLISSQT